MRSYGNYPMESIEWWDDTDPHTNDEAVDNFEWTLIEEQICAEEEEEE